MWLLLSLSCAEPGCPPGTVADPGAEARLRRRLAELDPALARTPARVCFAPGAEPALVEDGPVQLPSEGSDGRRAARLGHLLLHAHEPPEIRPGEACAGSVERALDLERAAIGAEARWLAAWGEPAPETEARLEELRDLYLLRCGPRR